MTGKVGCRREPPEWWSEARRLSAFGWREEAISRVIGVAEKSVAYAVDPDVRDYERECARERVRRWRAKAATE